MNTTVGTKAEQVRITKNVGRSASNRRSEKNKKTPGKPGIEADCKSDISLNNFAIDDSLWS